MPSRVLLSSTGRQEIERRVDELFDRLSTRLLGPYGPKKIYFEAVFDSMLSIPGLFTAASASAGGENPDEETRRMISTVASNYIEAEKAHAKAQVVHQIESAVSTSDKDDADAVMTALEGSLSELWGKVTAKVRTIVETETSSAKNEGYHDGIVKATRSMGIGDPVVFKIVVKDDVLCKVCKALWLMPNMVSPRLYRLSELGHGYMEHKHPGPTIGTTHPHCRCELTLLMPGFGFDAGGRVKYIGEAHDELTAQRGG